ncbi:hypothetical protein HanXRQr2_Chr09g0410931 [Helianthus annuus]|uniref:Uncharacterized protein n=1 Tax=Helianthus annuus TaxID=4232 RepID=A0A9K3NAE8_HELAN|nr:hypothetical protein HanXRQr2_Chr09g0410931 [Helianthus annuus]
MYVCIGICERRREEVGESSSAGGSRSCRAWGGDGHGGWGVWGGGGRTGLSRPSIPLSLSERRPPDKGHMVGSGSFSFTAYCFTD